MKKYIIILISFIYGCNGQSYDTQLNQKYVSNKNEFNEELTSHFPDKAIFNPASVVNSKNVKKNNVAFMLYEYQRNIKQIDSVINKIKDITIAKYTSNDSCLLIVNRFETTESYENRKDVKINDKWKVNRSCYQNLYPIPNFINYNNANEGSDLKLEGNFDIYVLEAKSGNHFKEFDLQPNPQMPIEWKNGYSRGVAISKEKSTIIYWVIIW